jgi:hypothetical protein
VSDPRDDRDRSEDRKQARRALLEAGALEAGKLWVGGFCDELRVQGRRAVGGWPGTMPEARARVIAYFTEELRRRNMVALTYEELNWVAKAAYAAAKRDWRALCEPDNS